MKPLVIISTLCLFILPTILRAQNSFGDWFVTQNGQSDESMAANINESGAALVEVCAKSTKTCRWLVVIDMLCDKGSRYPALGNTDGGAASFTLICDGKSNNGKSRYAFNSWSELEDLIKTGKSLGVAFPMEGGKFVVHRFSLRGMVAATGSMETEFFRRNGAKDNGSSTVVL